MLFMPAIFNTNYIYFQLNQLNYLGKKWSITYYSELDSIKGYRGKLRGYKP
jgi:hypothetical protein